MAVWLRERAARGQLAAPRILTSGPVFTAPDGYPTFMDDLPPPTSWLLGRLKIGLKSPDEARRQVDELAELGVDHIKALWTSEDYDDRRTPLPLLGAEELRALTERAHHHNLPVAVHNVWLKDLGPLLELPFDSLEHLPLDGVMEPRHVTRIKERDLPCTTTFMTYGIYDFVDELTELLQRHGETLMEPGALARVTEVVHELKARTLDLPGFGWEVIDTGMKFALQNMQWLREAGVRVVAGTDQGGALTPCGQIVWELRSFVRGGCSHLEALQAATSEAAEAIGRPELGGLRPGGPADVICVSANPAEDIRALEHVDVVIRDGIVFKNWIGAR
jgi:imidazolonepropionase-like amidohydrolase